MLRDHGCGVFVTFQGSLHAVQTQNHSPAHICLCNARLQFYTNAILLFVNCGRIVAGRLLPVLNLMLHSAKLAELGFSV